MNNLHFMHPAWFWLLLVIPAVWGMRWLRRSHQGQWERIVDKHLMPFVLSGKAGKLGLLPLVILSSALVVAVVAMAGPAWEKREVPVFRNQQALVVAMDFSASMSAEDEKPDRLTLARFKLLDVLKARKDGQTGLVVFAGDAFMVSPLTDDIDTIQEQAKNLSPDIMPAQGSRATPAIQRSAELLKQAGMAKGHILLITDGASDPDAAKSAAKEARQQGYQVSVLVVGTAAGAPIPRGQGGFLLDSAGKTVVAKVNLDELEDIANVGGGVFAHAALGDADLSALSAQWQAENDGKLTEGQGRQVDTWVNEGYWLVLLLLPLAALTFRRGWLGAALVCVLLPQPEQANAFGWTDLWKTPDQQAQQVMDSGKPADAAKLFHDPEWKGAAAYKSQDYATAAKQYANSTSTIGQYNYANALAKQGKLGEAIEAYERVLKADPKNEDAKYNLDVLKKAQEQQKQNQPQEQQNKSDQNQQQQQKQQDQQQNQAAQQQQQDKQDLAGKEGEQKEKEAEKQAEQQKQQQADKGKQESDKEKEAQAQQEDPQQREQEQATEQWLRRIPDDPAGLWRRKFQYQYQQRGTQARGDEW
ncbi:MAG: VWA domain-containing protein [Thiothrix sp.]|uniref:VWA domain-containing protein n=1 Tax=Thiothrix sp. TaxID=1032 RepID=UPI00262A71D7|nr:VWA domain-containing protein [Thiothrix sp.]MDD5393861.1 VWA domain-containing protein [Thiothrix sp.]